MTYNLQNFQSLFQRILEKQQEGPILAEYNIEESRQALNMLFAKQQQTIQATQVNIFFIGAVSSGKSTLINALLRRKVLFTNLHLGTGAIFQIMQSPNTAHPSYADYEVDGIDIVAQSLNQQLEFQRKPNDGKITVSSKFFELFGDLGPKIALYDTPGLKDDDPGFNQQLLRRLIQTEPNHLNYYTFVLNYRKHERELRLLFEALQSIQQQQPRGQEERSSLCELLESSIFYSGKIDEAQEQYFNYSIVLNKCDEADQDSSSTLDIISQLEDRYKNIYKVSARDAYYKECCDLEGVYKDYQVQQHISTEKQAKDHFKRCILNNDKLLVSQDFCSFLRYLNFQVITQYKMRLLNNYHHSIRAKLSILSLHLQQIEIKLSFDLYAQIQDLLDDFKKRLREFSSQLNVYWRIKQEERRVLMAEILQSLHNNKSLTVVKQKLLDYQVSSSNFLLKIIQEIGEEYSKHLMDYLSQFSKQVLNLIDQDNNFEQVNQFENMSLLEHCRSIVRDIQTYLQCDEKYLRDSFASIANQPCTPANLTLKSLLQGFVEFANNFSSDQSFLQIFKHSLEIVANQQIADSKILLENIQLLERRFMLKAQQYIETQKLVCNQVGTALQAFLLEFQ